MVKRYPLNQSPLYRLKGRGQLERLLRFKLSDLGELTADSSYRVWEEDGRWIQAPRGDLAVLHNRIAQLLKRIEIPDYVFSKKGRSHIDNAAQHVGSVPLIKTDISKFYPSTTREMVLRMFVEEFRCALDLAHALADICCFQAKHLPTGSALSGYVAFLAAKPTFDRVHALAVAEGCNMTAFVDDVAISGRAAGMSMLLRVRREFQRGGLRTSNRKSRAFGARQPKRLTGSIVTAQGLLLPNRQHQNIRVTRRELATALTDDERRKLTARLRGQVEAAKQLQNHPKAARRDK